MSLWTRVVLSARAMSRVLSSPLSASLNKKSAGQSSWDFEELEPRVMLTATLGHQEEVVAMVAGDDKYDDNDTFETAKELKHKGKSFFAADLVSNDDDWFKFKTTGTGGEAAMVQIGFENLLGNLNLELYNSSGQLIRQSLSPSENYELISLNGLAGGTYYLRVFNPNGETGQGYDLSLAPPSKFDGEHTLFLNFDGASLSRQELLNWSSDGGWFAGAVDYFDSDQNGIQISDFLANVADREKIIASIIKYVQTDLKKFGIQVVRHFGDAVEGVEATTIFLGPSTLTGGYHIANSIDVGNDNMTDIAFVGNENWGNAKSTSIAMADVTLHEAGHTFGLYHVVSGKDNETMGLRYNEPNQDKWVRNTQFRNEYYDVLPGHGPDIRQNAAAYMKSVFVTNSSSPVGQINDPNWDGFLEDHMDSLPTIGWDGPTSSLLADSISNDVSESLLAKWDWNVSV